MFQVWWVWVMDEAIEIEMGIEVGAGVEVRVGMEVGGGGKGVGGGEVDKGRGVVDTGSPGVIVGKGVRVGRVVNVGVFSRSAGVMVAKVTPARCSTVGVRNVSAAGVMAGVGRVLGCGR